MSTADTTGAAAGTTGAAAGTTGAAADTSVRARALPVTDLSLVVLIGASGSGKSTFARRHFTPTEVISSDFCRGLVADDENDQSASRDAFDVLHYIAGKRLAAGRRTVVDATNVQQDARRQLIELARKHDVLPIAIVLDVPEQVCAERNATRSDRADMPRRVIQRHTRELRRSLRHLEREGFRKVHVLRGTAEAEHATVVTEKRFNDLTHLTGPFDIVGDIHGCAAELETLLGKLGYTDGVHPDGRTAVFVGDLVDRGPDSPGVLRRVMSMVKSGNALCVPGNHENKYGRFLKGRKVQHTHGLAETVEQMDGESEEFRAEVREFIDSLVSHYVLDGGRLVVCHAGLPEKYHGRTSGRVRSHALYGDTTGETDEFGLPVRYPWAEDYRGRAAVVYGHTPVPEATWLNNTICLDTGAVFGGRLTALRWPEREIVDVPAERVWYEPAKPLRTEAPGGHDGRPLDLADVQGRRVVETRHAGRITVREENGAAALEVMSRFATDPRLLPYLPPTMAPTATSGVDGYLEHPKEAFAQYAADGVARVVCEEKHMGSRAVALVCRDADAARTRFGVDGPTGSLYTRTGRPFLDDASVTEEILDRLRTAIGEAGLWDELATDWLLLDTELMPWSLKASGLLRSQYAAVGAASGPVRRRGRLHRRLPPLLLAHRGPGRRPPGPVPDPGRPGPQPGRAAARRAARPPRPARRARRQRPVADHPAPVRRHRRPRVGVGGRRLVAGDDRPRRRGHGRQARRRPGTRRQGPPGAARHQVPRPRVPADHLRPRVHPPRQPRPAQAPLPEPQAVAGGPRVRPRPGGPGPARGRRAAVAGARGGVRSAGPGVGAGGPAAVTSVIR